MSDEITLREIVEMCELPTGAVEALESAFDGDIIAEIAVSTPLLIWKASGKKLSRNQAKELIAACADERPETSESSTSMPSKIEVVLETPGEDGLREWLAKWPGVDKHESRELKTLIRQATRNQRVIAKKADGTIDVEVTLDAYYRWQERRPLDTVHRGYLLITAENLEKVIRPANPFTGRELDEDDLWLKVPEKLREQIIYALRSRRASHVAEETVLRAAIEGQTPLVWSKLMEEFDLLPDDDPNKVEARKHLYVQEAGRSSDFFEEEAVAAKNAVSTPSSVSRMIDPNGTPEEQEEHDNRPLFGVMRKKLNVSELQNICMHIGVEYDDLPGSGPSNKSRELIYYCERYDMISNLLDGLTAERSDFDWRPYFR